MSTVDYDDLIGKVLSDLEKAEPGSAKQEHLAKTLANLENARNMALKFERGASEEQEIISESPVIRVLRAVASYAGPVAQVLTCTMAIGHSRWMHEKTYSEHAKMNYLDRDGQNEINNVSKAVTRRI